jgi:hypothetical protein
MPVINKKTMERRKLTDLGLAATPLLGSLGLAYLSYDSMSGPFADNGMPELLLAGSVFAAVIGLLTLTSVLRQK